MIVTFRSFLAPFLLLFGMNLLSAQSTESDKVLANEALRFAAMTRADTSALKHLLAEDLVYVHSNAMVENKAEHLAAIASRKLVYEKMERESASVRFYGKTALVNGTVKVRGILKGNTFELPLLYLAVYRKKQGRWLLVNWQSTRIP
jgi:ketosteroid isomerase-like protein